MLAKVKAELRAHVFEAVQQKDGAGSNRRRSVSDLPRGALMASLVAEYLEWSGCDYAARVFAAEIGEVDVRSNASRDALARELGLRDAAPDAPLLHALLGRSRPEIPGAGVGQKTPATAGSTAVPPWARTAPRCGRIWMPDARWKSTRWSPPYKSWAT